MLERSWYSRITVLLDIKKKGELCPLLIKHSFFAVSPPLPLNSQSLQVQASTLETEILISSAQVEQNEKGKKTYTHLDFHMLCSQEANIIPWMLVIKQCDMNNCYALSLFRQVFFLLNKPLKGLKYNHSQLSAHKFFPSCESWPYPTIGPCFYLHLIPCLLDQVMECNETIWHSGNVEKLNTTRALGAWPGRRPLSSLPKEIGARL